MLSIETPPGPSCPCKASLLRTDDRAPDQLPSEEADPVGLCENQTPNFSIRDFVFTSRSKDIAVNWPFPRQFLQLCLKHGVRDPLPPFELPDSVRERFYRKATESDQSVACSGAQKISSQFESPDIKDAGPVNEELCNLISESCLQSDELVSCLDRAARHPLIEKQFFDHGEISDAEPSQDDAETVTLLTKQDQIERISDQSSELHCSIQVTRSVSETPSEVEVAELYPLPSKLESLRDPSEKKCRLIVKFGAITETSRTEDVVSTCSTVSDPMASKVCPVCKLFASTSNTTLNAHIDQCLSADSNIKQVATQIPNKVKATKKRLMVDIYATAPYCTLEELDKRNGTNWASEVTLMAPTNEACSEVKRPKMPPVDIRDDEKPVDIRDDGNKGAVYVDSNGIKLRILSKFNDTPPMTSREHFKLKKHAKPIKEGKSLLICKKKRFGSKYSKYMKVKQPNKKRSSSKLFKSETRAVPEEEHHADTYLEKEESPYEMLNTPDQTKSSASTTLRHWVCSKRSNLPKKHNHKDINNLENSLLKTKNILAESNQLDVCYPSIVENHALKVSKPSEDSRSRSKTKIVDFLSNNVQIMDNGKKSPKQPVFNSKCSSESASKNGLILKISRSLGTSIYSPRIRSEEIQMSTIQKSDNSPDMTMETSGSCHSSMKAKKSLSTKKNVLFERQHSSEGSKGDLGNKLSISKKFRKHRSILVTGKKGELPSDINGKLCRSIKHVGIDAARISKTLRSHRPDLSEGIHRSVTQDIMDQESPTTTNTSESAEDASTMRKQKYSTLKCLNSNIECHDADLVTSDRQVTACVDNAKPSLKIAVGDPVGTEPIISENLTPDSNAKSDPRPSEVGNVQSVCGSEARVEPLAEKMCDDQAIQSCNINGICDEVISQSIQVADEVGSRRELEIYAAQETECLVETISVQGSTACLTCHGDGAFEIPQENSSITSHRITSYQGHHLAVDREPTGSPISTASTISPPSPKDSVSVHDQSGLGVPCVTDVDVIKPRNLERRNQEAKVFPLAKEPEQFSEDQPCCCLRREGLSRESQFLRHGVMAVTMPPSKGKQISNLSITESMSSSFSSYLSLRTDVMATPILESPTGSIITKASVDCSGKAPTYIDFSSPSPSPRTQTQSNSILRLMGKNLMVANKEESAQLPMVYHSATDIPSNAHCLPPGFATTCYEGFPYHHHQFPCGSTFFGEDPTVASHQIPQYSSNMRVGSFAGSLQAGMKMKPDQILRKVNKKPNSLSACNMERLVASHQQHERTVSSSQANMVKEVIVIDDSPDFEHELKCSMPNPAGILPAIPGSNPMQQRPVSYVPPQSQFFPRNVTSGGFIPYPNAWPRGYDFANTMNQGKASEVSNPIPPRPFMSQPHSTGRQHALFGTKHYPAMAAKHSAPENHDLGGHTDASWW